MSDVATLWKDIIKSNIPESVLPMKAQEKMLKKIKKNLNVVQLGKKFSENLSNYGKTMFDSSFIYLANVLSDYYTSNQVKAKVQYKLAAIIKKIYP